MTQYYPPPPEQPYDADNYYDYNPLPPRPPRRSPPHQESPGCTGFIQGLGISAGLISAPILIGVVVILAFLALCALCCFASILIGLLMG